MDSEKLIEGSSALQMRNKSKFLFTICKTDNSFPSLINSTMESACGGKQNLNIINNNLTKLNSDIQDNQINSNYRKVDFKVATNEERVASSGIQSNDFSDLSFLSNDFLFNDCTCFEQASQLVDPTLNASESTPFSFNNNDMVQLFRYTWTDGAEDNIILNNNLDDLIHKNFSEKCNRIFQESDKMQAVNNHNFYHLFELFDGNMNLKKEPIKGITKHELLQPKKQNISKVKKIKREVVEPIRKGRRYLPDFKQRVLEYTKAHTFKETALYFKINCNTITEWSRESKRLSQKHKSTTSRPATDSKNYKTDKLGMLIPKTEIILFNDDISLETDSNEPPIKNVEEELGSSDMTPDERFLKWIAKKRLQKKELSRLEVFHIAKYCIKNSNINSKKSLWFILWFKRYNKVLKNLTSCNIETEKYIKYPINFKIEVALYARIFTKNSAARVFNVSRRRMFDWFNYLNPMKSSVVLCNKNKTSDYKEYLTDKDKIIFSGRKNKIKNKMYSELHLWYQKMFFSGARPTSKEIKEKAREIFSIHGISGIKFSDGWLSKFCQRMNIKLRHSEDDHLLLWILTQFDNNISLSHQEITKKSALLMRGQKFKGSKGWTLRFLKRHKNLLQNSPTCYDQLPQIVQEKLNIFWENYNQSLRTFSIVPDSIGCMDEIPISFRYPEESKFGGKPLLRKAGFENCQAIVILSALANGQLLPPAIVFKGNGPKKLFSSKNVDILVLYQEKGLITVDLLKDWMEEIWFKCALNPSILVIDSFEPHCAIKKLLQQENCLVQIIPEGCSSKFQPLNVETASMFKECVRNQWKEYTLRSDLYSSKIIKRYKCPDPDTILHWVQNSYEKVKRNTNSIIHSFKATGLLQ